MFFNFVAAVTACSDFGARENNVCHCFHFLSICHEVMGPDAMFFVFWMLIKPTFSLSSFTFIKRPFSFSLLSAIRVVSSAYLRFWIFLLPILIPACDSSGPVWTWIGRERERKKKIGLHLRNNCPRNTHTQSINKRFFKKGKNCSLAKSKDQSTRASWWREQAKDIWNELAWEGKGVRGSSQGERICVGGAAGRMRRASRHQHKPETEVRPREESPLHHLPGPQRAC